MLVVGVGSFCFAFCLIHPPVLDQGAHSAPTIKMFMAYGLLARARLGGVPGAAACRARDRRPATAAEAARAAAAAGAHTAAASASTALPPPAGCSCSGSGARACHHAASTLPSTECTQAERAQGSAARGKAWKCSIASWAARALFLRPAWMELERAEGSGRPRARDRPYASRKPPAKRAEESGGQ